MTNVSDVLSGPAGQFLETYWLFILGIVMIWVVFFYIGVFRIFAKAVQQVVVMGLMAVSVMVWYVLATRHWSTVDVPSFIKISNTDPNAILKDEKLVNPISEILLVTGMTVCLLGILYRSLAVTLIPDCIPCIGKYDNMLAALFAIFGVILVSVAIYFQLTFAVAPNSTQTVLNQSGKYWEDINEFAQSEDETKWESLVDAVRLFADNGQKMLVESYHVVFGQIQQRFGAADADANDMPRQDL